MIVDTNQLMLLLAAVLLLVAGFVVLCVAVVRVGTGSYRRTRLAITQRAAVPVNQAQRHATRRLLIIAGSLVCASFLVSLIAQLM